jgi:hypothetical protein
MLPCAPWCIAEYYVKGFRVGNGLPSVAKKHQILPVIKEVGNGTGMNAFNIVCMAS